MENMIKITPQHTIDGKPFLKVTLLPDGVKLLSEGTTIADLYDNEPDKDGKKLILSPDGMIYSNVFIPQDNENVFINIHRSAPYTNHNLIKRWIENPAFEAEYYPHVDNEVVLKDVKTMLAANHWAVYSDEKLAEVAILVNKRYLSLSNVNEKMLEAAHILKSDSYKANEKYKDMVQDVSSEIEAEMDYCIEKNNIIKKICFNDFNLKEKVSVLYRKYRGVVDVKPTKMNVKIQDDEES